MSESAYPIEKPPMPKMLKGIATVKGVTGSNVLFTVNFDTGECDCPHGQAWRWDNRRWVAGNLCNHKLKCIASMIDGLEKPNPELTEYYESSVGKRHNAFVAVSAMHKELRLGNVEATLYWATCMVAHRGLVGIINYLRNIVFEETRDINLYRYILQLSSQGKSVTRLDMNRAIRRFAEAPKKWELPWRLDTFIAEQRGYQQLAEKYSYNVAKPSDIIAKSEMRSLHSSLLKGFAEANLVKVQYGLKGLLKSQSDNSGKHSVMVFNFLVDVLNGDFPNKFDWDEDYTRKLHELILMRIRNHGAPVYHEINALCDALTGERGADSTCTLPTLAHKRIVASPRVYTLPLGDMRRIPLYANDNHTWPGKALLRQYGATELKPGVEQTHIDFRLCGAYSGVAWRLLAFKQHATIDCKWSAVSWRQPPWLWGHVENMFY